MRPEVEIKVRASRGKGFNAADWNPGTHNNRADAIRETKCQLKI